MGGLYVRFFTILTCFFAAAIYTEFSHSITRLLQWYINNAYLDSVAARLIVM